MNLNFSFKRQEQEHWCKTKWKNKATTTTTTTTKQTNRKDIAVKTLLPLKHQVTRNPNILLFKTEMYHLSQLLADITPTGP